MRKLAPGSVLQSDATGNVRIAAYWDAVSPDHPQLERCSEEESAATVRHLLDEAVRKRMGANVPVGAFLSGGVDSNSVVALMAQHSSRPVRTFCLGIEDLPQYSEFEFARQVSERYQTEHQEIRISHEQVAGYIPRMVRDLDEPLAAMSCVPLHFVSKLARENGVPVILTGEGSDELFFGYDFRLDLLRCLRWRWAPLLAIPRPLLRDALAAVRLSQHTLGYGAYPERVLALAAQGPERVLAYSMQTLELFGGILQKSSNDLTLREPEVIVARMRKS